MPRSLILTTALFALLAGCASVPDLGPKPVPAAAGAFESAASFADANGEWPAEGWWRSFGDAQLAALIAEGLEGSPDVAIAAVRVRAAEAMAQQAGAALLPRVGAEARAGGVQQRKNMGIPTACVPAALRRESGRE